MLSPGQNVRYLSDERKTDPQHCPPVGTVGKLLSIDTADKDTIYLVKWPKSCGVSKPYCWWHEGEDLEAI